MFQFSKHWKKLRWFLHPFLFIYCKQDERCLSYKAMRLEMISDKVPHSWYLLSVRKWFSNPNKSQQQLFFVNHFNKKMQKSLWWASNWTTQWLRCIIQVTINTCFWIIPWVNSENKQLPTRLPVCFGLKKTTLSGLHWLITHSVAAANKHHRAIQFPVISQKLLYLCYVLPDNSFCACDGMYSVHFYG